MRNTILKKILKETENPYYNNKELEYWYSISHLNNNMEKDQEKIKQIFSKINETESYSKKKEISKEFIHNFLIPQYEANSGCNFILSNVPEIAGDVIVDESSIYETFKPYGDIYNVKKIEDRVYIWFHNKEDAEHVISCVNNMQIGENIIYAKSPKITENSSPLSTIIVVSVASRSKFTVSVVSNLTTLL